MFKTSFFLEGPEGSDPFRLAGEAAAATIAAGFPTLTGYIQSRTLTEQVDPSAGSPFTGVAELWFGTEAEAFAAEREAGRLEGLLSDGTRPGPTVSGMMRTVMRLPSFYEGGLIKGVFPFRRQERLSVEDFQHYWWLKHGPIAALTEGSGCYSQCHPVPARYAERRPPFDGVTELYWKDVAAARAAMSSRQMVEDQSTDAKNFAEPGSVILFLAREEAVLPV